MKNNKKQKIAIIFYGLTRSLKNTIKSIKEHLFKLFSDNSIDFDIFIHTYKIYGKYENKWSGEYTPNYVNEDIETLLKPSHFIYDNQEDIIKNINFEEYYEKLGVWSGETPEMTKYLIQNLCLALYSKKKITNLFEKYKDNYDYAIITRPDLEFKAGININWLKELDDDNIIIPECDSYSGCNDRFCIGKPSNIIYYGTLFDSLKEYSKEISIISEKYMLDMLNKKGINIIQKTILYKTLRMSVPIVSSPNKIITKITHKHIHKCVQSNN